MESSRIFVSTSCVKNLNIFNSINLLASNGFKNIELSGGTDYYPGLQEDLRDLKVKYGLTYKIHNYFPPPKVHSVINLASNSQAIIESTLEIIYSALQIVDQGIAEEYSFHAGFLFEMDLSDLGTARNLKQNIISRNIGYSNFKHQVIEHFIEAGRVPIIENNVISKTNYSRFGNNPFLFTCSKEIIKAKEDFEFNLLLDLAHLKVSSSTLGYDFIKEAEALLPHTRYIHVSENDSRNDLNLPLKKESEILDMLKKFAIKGCDYTLETYGSLKDIEESYNNLMEVI